MKNSEVRYMFMKYCIENDFANCDCHADDFLSDKNKVVIADETDGDFYSMTCFQNAVLVKAKKDIYGWSKDFVSKHIGFRCFDGQQVAALCKELFKHNYTLQGGQALLPDMTVKRAPLHTGFNIRVYNNDEINDLCSQSINLNGICATLPKILLW